MDRQTIRQKVTQYAPDGGALAVLALAVFLFYRPVILGQAWLPRGGGDLASFLYPMYRFAAQSLTQGQLPLWNPYQYAGTPFLADNQSGLFYPFNLLLFLLQPNFGYGAMEGLVVGHLLWAGVGMYFCLRGLRLAERISPVPALIGALAFMFSDIFVIHAGNLNLIAVSAWLPWIFAALHWAMQSVHVKWAISAGILLGIATLAGHGQMSFILVCYLGMYGVYAAFCTGNFWGKKLILLGVMGVVALGVAAISVVPALELTPFTRRGSFDLSQTMNYSLPPQALLGLVAPHFYGRGAINFWGDWARVEVGYAGVVSWMLAAFALRTRINRQTLFFVLAGGLFLLLAMGKFTPLYAFIFSNIPIPFQVPARFVLLLDFSLAALAAIGAESLQRSHTSRYLFWQGGVAILFFSIFLYGAGIITQQPLASDAQQGQMAEALSVFVGLWFAGWVLINRRLYGSLPVWLIAPACFLLLAVDLISQGYWVELESNRPTVGFENDLAQTYLQADAGIHRLDVAAGAWQPNTAQIARLYDIGGVYNPLQLSNHAVYMDSLGYRGSALYNLLGVKYIVADKGHPPADQPFIVPVYVDDPQIDVYLNTHALPRAFLLYQSEWVADSSAAFTAVHADSFDPWQKVVVQGGMPALTGPTGIGRVDLIRYDLNFLALDVQTDQPAYLFLSDIYHPAWRASLNGVEVPILPANLAFRAVYVDAGSYRLEMWFDPYGWKIGLGLTVATWLVLLGWLVYKRLMGNNSAPSWTKS